MRQLQSQLPALSPQLDGSFRSDNADFTSGVPTGNIGQCIVHLLRQEDIELDPDRVATWLSNRTCIWKTTRSSQSVQRDPVCGARRRHSRCDQGKFSTRTGNMHLPRRKAGEFCWISAPVVPYY